MAHFNFALYMENLAAEHKLIRHGRDNHRFYKMSSIGAMEEVLTRLLTSKTPAIGMNDTMEGRIIDNDGDNRVDRQLYTFYVFGRAALFDHEQRKQVVKEIKKIAADCCDRIIADHYRDFNFQSSIGLRHLDVNSLSYRTLGALPDGLLAIVASFVVDVPITKSESPWDDQNKE